MPARETARQRGKRLGRVQRRRIGEELRLARVGVGLSLREVGRRVGLSHSAVARRERGEIETLSIDQIAVMAGVLGLELRVGLFPGPRRSPPRATRAVPIEARGDHPVPDRGSDAHPR